MGSREEAQGFFFPAKVSGQFQLVQWMVSRAENGMGIREETLMNFDFSSKSEHVNYILQMVYKEAEVDPEPLCTLSPLLVTGGSPLVTP